MYEKWVSHRFSSGETTLLIPALTLGGATAIAYVDSFNLDYNPLGLFVVNRLSNVVTIKSTDPNIEFTSIVGFLNKNNDPLDFTSVITNFNTSANVISITDVSFSASDTDICNKIKVTATTNIAPVTANYSLFGLAPINIPNPTTTSVFEIPRDTQFQFNVTGTANSNVHRSDGIPKLQSPTVSIINTPVGATINIIIHVFTGLTLTYSIDDVNYQTNNVFTTLPNGNYTCYVKDQFGCKKSVSVVVDGVSTNEKFFAVSDSNSLMFAIQETTGTCTTFKNDKNTLSYQEDVKAQHKEIQLYQTCDTVPNQFLSSFNVNEVNVIDDTGTKTPVQITKKSNFIGIKDKRDCTIFNYGNGKTGIYFTSGNKYDYDTNAVLPDNYILNGKLPAFAEIGNYISLNNTWFEIENITFDESREYEVIVISNVYTGIDAPSVISSIYNLEPYEIYDFYIDFSTYADKLLQVEIIAGNNEVIALSEFICVKEFQPKTMLLKAYNKSNNDVYYDTGIVQTVRLGLKAKQIKDDEEIDVNTTDTSSDLVKSLISEAYEFSLYPITTYRVKQIRRLVSHEFVFIDGQRYVIKSFEQGDRVGDSNLYEVKFVMLKAEDNYTNKGVNQINYALNDVPSIISVGNASLLSV